MSHYTTEIPQKESPLFFISLKVAGAIPPEIQPIGVFDDRAFSDEFISSLINCIDQEAMNIYGFVILSTQIHLIISPRKLPIEQSIDALKSASAYRILHLAGQKIALNDKSHTPEQLWMRRYFSQFINTGVANFWRNDRNANAIKIKIHSDQLKPLTSDLLLEYLKSTDKNYLHLGAEAFTKLMLDSMRTKKNDSTPSSSFI